MFHTILFVSPITLSLLIFLIVIALIIFFTNKTVQSDDNQISTECDETVATLPLAPGPKSYPIIGSMHLLGKYEVPYQAFGELAKTYGPIIKMDLGSVPSLIVNGQENIREVLFTKGTHFDSRPNFKRYHHLFSGDKENSLAFCNWSNLQKSRREMLRPHTFPTSFSRRFQELDQIILNEIPEMLSHFTTNARGENIVDLKEVVLKSCANVFMDYFCTKKFTWSSKEFEQMIFNYDEVFYEVNQGYAADFLPFLLPLHAQNFTRMTKLTQSIRKFVVDNVIGGRFDAFTDKSASVDYVDALIQSVKVDNTAMDWDTALFALEDIIGGHSAVGNFLIKVLSFLVQNPDAQRKMQAEIDECLRNKQYDNYYTQNIQSPEVDIFRSEHEDAYVTTDMDKLELETIIEQQPDVASITTTETDDDQYVTLCMDEKQTNKRTKNITSQDRISIKDRNSMPYTEAVILEGIRLIASPIVPHVANQDSSVGGYKVPKDTLIFLNNYELNMSEKLWDEPKAFRPERFIKNGKVQKPDYFLPFGGGKRSCMGYKMVQLIGFSILSNIIQSYTLKPSSCGEFKVPIGNLALKPNVQINYCFEKRDLHQ